MIIWVFGFVLFLLERAAGLLLAGYTISFFFQIQSGFCGGKDKVGRGRMHVLTKQIQRRLSFPSSLYHYLSPPYLALSLVE
jgi:hypothetical protein